MHEISQDLEGIGPVRTYFVEVEDLAGPLAPVPDPSWPRRIGGTFGMVGRGLRYMRPPRVRHVRLTDRSPRGSVGVARGREPLGVARLEPASRPLGPRPR